jgi:hypothetical protein
MPMLELSDEQVIELAKRLPREKQDALLRELLLLRWSNWESLSQYGQARAGKGTSVRHRIAAAEAIFPARA